MLHKYKMFLEGFVKDFSDEALNISINKSRDPNSKIGRIIAQNFKNKGITPTDLAAAQTAIALNSPQTSFRGDRLIRDKNAASVGALVGTVATGATFGLTHLLKRKTIQRKNWEKYGCSNIKNEKEKSKCKEFLNSRN